MTATLVAKNVAGGFAHRTLFEGLDVTVAPGDVVGVVGANGAGKSTLLRILAGDLEEVAEPRKEWTLEFAIGAAPRSSSVAATLDNAVVRQGEFVLGPVSLQVDAGSASVSPAPTGQGSRHCCGCS